MIRLAIVSPCYNEEAVVAASAKRLLALLESMAGEGLVMEDSMLVLVNDGSTDSTWPTIRELHQADSRVRGICLSRNTGHQNALMAGMMTARDWADAVVTIDIDLQDDIACIPQMVRHFEAGCDVVYGVKVSRKGDSLLKRMSAQAFYKLQETIGTETIYNHADFRLLSRRALDMLSAYKEKDLYLRGLIPLLGLPSATVDDVISERRIGRSKYPLRRMICLATTGITAFSVKPLLAIVYAGILFFFVALCIAIYVIWSLATGEAVTGWTSLMLSVWLVGGFIIFSIGIASIYIVNIYKELKNRPPYHIIETL